MESDAASLMRPRRLATHAFSSEEAAVATLRRLCFLLLGLAGRLSNHDAGEDWSPTCDTSVCFCRRGCCDESSELARLPSGSRASGDALRHCTIPVANRMI